MLTAPNYTINPGIKPSSRSNYEFGFDIRFLQNRLGLSATYFQYKDGPNISNQSISETSGLNYFTNQWLTTKRTGGEISYGTPIQARDFRWDVLVNWSTYKEVYAAFAGGANRIDNGTGYPYHIGDRVDKLFGHYEAQTPDGKVIHDESGFPIYLPKAQYLAMQTRIGHGELTINSLINHSAFPSSLMEWWVAELQDYVLRKLTEGGRGENTDEGIIGQARLYESALDRLFGDDPWLCRRSDANGIPILGGDGVQVVGGAGKYCSMTLQQV